MSKKSIQQKEVRRFIKNKLEEGAKRKEILAELSEIYYDEKTLSKHIASTVSPQKKARYKWLNQVLLGLLLLTIVMKVLFGVLLLKDASPIFVLLLIFLPVINIIFAIQVYNYQGFAYGFLGFVSAYSIFRSITEAPEIGSWIYVDLAIGALILILAFYLKAKMFPQLGLLGTKNGPDSEIVLGD